MARVQKRPFTAFDDNETVHPSRESSPQSYKLGARSCQGCHQRKVRCDRGLPCTNCFRSGITCVYPTKDKDEARKPITLQNISNRLERLEVLLSRLIEAGQVTTRPIADRGSGETQAQIQVQHCANLKAVDTTNQPSSNQGHRKSTWQLLLNDGQVVQSTSNSDTDALLQNVGLDFLRCIHVLLHSIKLSYDECS
jgi:hypothetical protein